MGPIEVLVLLVFLVVVVAFAGRGFQVDDEYVERWSRSAGVVLTSDSRPVVHRYLLWSRRARTFGGLIGFVAPTIYSRVIVQRALEGNYELGFMFAGYLIGALVAEIAINRPRRRPGTALLVPRRLGDYLPSYVPLLQRALGLLSLALLVVYALWPSKPANLSPSPTEVVAFGLSGACLAVVIESLQRVLVARRQPITDTGELAVDDAMRSSSLHVIAAAGIALLLHIVGGEVMVISVLTGDNGPEGFLGWSLLACGALLALSSIFIWVSLSKPHGFKVWRGDGESVSA